MLKLLLGDPNARKLKRYQPFVSDINLLEEEIAPLSDDDLRSRTAEFRQRLDAAGSLEKQRPLLDDLLPEAFAVVQARGSAFPWGAMSANFGGLSQPSHFDDSPFHPPSAAASVGHPAEPPSLACVAFGP